MMSSKKKVLEEEDYVKKIEEIIERDFFPDFQKLKDQNDYNEAEAKKDFSRMRELEIKISANNSKSNCGVTPLQPTPSSFETPITSKDDSLKRPSDDSTVDTSKKAREEVVKEKHKNLSLDSFLGKYSSEDCESFEAVQQKSEEERLEKNAWLFEAEEKHNEMIKNMLKLEHEKEKVLAITDGKKNSGNLVSATKSNKSMTVPLNTWAYKAKNHLMYYPEGHHPSANDDLLFKKPTIIHKNTRLAKNPFENRVTREKLDRFAMEKKRMDEEKVGADGKQIVSPATPRVRGFTFVSDMPSPMPGVADSPLMTWGELGSTPERISTPGTPAFKFPEESARDKIAHRMVEDVMKKNKAKKEKALKQIKASMRATPKYMRSCDRISTLSPAAQKLFGKKLTRGTDKMLKASYTPSPRVRSSSRTPSRIKTPKSRLKTPTPQDTSVTDNLLKFSQTSQNSRKTASDFF